MIVSARDLAFTYPGSDVNALGGVSFALEQGELLAVLGPNGSGKTTLLRLLLGTGVPGGGDVEMFGKRSTEWSRQELARRVAVVSQSEAPVFPLRVEEAVGLGRYPHLGALENPKTSDRDAVDEAMRVADVESLAERWTQNLSGGEWQRVRLARALAQEPELLILDEPTANLDLRHEMEVFAITAEIVSTKGIAAVMVTHNVNLAARFAHRVLLLDGGRIVESGDPSQVLTPELLGDVYGWPVEQFEWEGHRQFIPSRKPRG